MLTSLPRLSVWSPGRIASEGGAKASPPRLSRGLWWRRPTWEAGPKRARPASHVGCGDVGHAGCWQREVSLIRCVCVCVCVRWIIVSIHNLVIEWCEIDFHTPNCFKSLVLMIVFIFWSQMVGIEINEDTINCAFVCGMHPHTWRVLNSLILYYSFIPVTIQA